MKRKQKTLIVYHFASKTLRDGTKLPKKGDKLPHIENPKPCERGWHGSVDVLDALQYAPGFMVAKRKLSGVIVPHENNKHCASDAEMLTGYVDAKYALVRFARYCALTALRVDAANALRKAGLVDHANSLANLHDDCDLNSAGAAGAARDARRKEQSDWLTKEIELLFK